MNSESESVTNEVRCSIFLSARVTIATGGRITIQENEKKNCFI